MLRQSSTRPVILVTGFLGAGKTTLMRRLILDGHARGLRVCVIVNEFGASDVDGHILQQADAELLQSITGGCACCSGQDDFQQTLLEIASRKDEEKPDAILVEASGLADPLILLETLAVPGLMEKLRVAALLCVADAGRQEEYSPRAPLAPLLNNQLRLADFILINKADLCERRTLLALGELIHDIAPRARLIPTQECAMNFDEVWVQALEMQETENGKQKTEENLKKIQNPKSNHAHDHAYSHTLFCPLPHPVERERLEEALSALPAEVWRAKGFARVRGEGGVLLVQYTGGGSGKGRFRLAPFHLPQGGAELPLGLVFIGAHLDEKELLSAFLGKDKLLAFL